MTNIVAVDWGTSSLRIWGMDLTGTVTAERRSSEGMFSLKPSEFPIVLERHLTELNIAAKIPAIICGMAGAAAGWVEAPYMDAPASLSGLVDAAVETRTEGRRILILPGIAQRAANDPDVMRGEETLLLGAQINGRAKGLICLPGTHSKWVEVRGGVVRWFKTSMTGEAFALFSKKSTLAQFASGDSLGLGESSVFTDAVAEALEAPHEILHKLFSIRSGPLLQGYEKAAHMPARLSGLLIGQEVAGMKVREGQDVTLVSSGGITQSYANALRIAGAKVHCLDADKMVRAGLHYCGQQILLPSSS